MNLYHNQHCPAAVLYGTEPQRPKRILELALDRERLQSLIDLLSRYDLDDDCGSRNADLSIQMRAFGPLQS